MQSLVAGITHDVAREIPGKLVDHPFAHVNVVVTLPLCKEISCACLMGLPEAERALIDQAKILGYLLSPTHPTGLSKAAFFSKHGFSINRWEVLAQALRRQAKTGTVQEIRKTTYGTRYVIDGFLAAPDGTRLNVRSVWFINEKTGVPRFATAHPLRRKASDRRT